MFDYSDHRAAQARLGVKFTNTITTLLYVGAVLLLVTGLAIGVALSSIGWLVASFAAWLFMIARWATKELHTLSPSGDGETVQALLVPSILGRLPKLPSPSNVVMAMSYENDTFFYGARFGVTTRFMQDIASREQSDFERLWNEALEARSQTGTIEVNAGHLAYALLKQYPDHQSILAHNHMELEDILQGITWQLRLKNLIKEHARPVRTGGIARDWSFGYTPLLGRFGQNISASARGNLSISLDAHEDATEQLIQTFSNKGRQNAILVGPAGSGKTTIVHSFAERLLDASAKISPELQFRQIVLLDASALIAAAPGRGQIEDLIMRVFGEAFAAKNIILCLDNAQLFFEEGIGSVDIANMLIPILEAGRLKVILTIDEQRYLQISQRNPALANATNRITIASATKDETIEVMQNQLILYEFNRKVTYTYQSLQEAYRLSERYIHDLAMPGRALKLLESASAYAENGLVTINSVQQAIEKTMDVKVSVASDSAERERLLNLEDLIHERMINQTQAVSAVSDALRRARAGVRNENRPIGTFLFLGPTGVGKTELAKALADVYFGGEGRIVRLDLNEFVRAEDVSRLIADGAEDPISLTAQVMRQPFSVVLLDEIEKAHPSVLTTLLQLLDEGILRDLRNREVSFRDAIVIATSNAGADRIREYIERGYETAQFQDQFIDELISSNQFRPEFLNRFDEIVTFRPLTKPELVQVVDLMIAGVNKTLAAQKISVEVEQGAKEKLVDKGYDPRLGARPMRRTIQKIVENNVANAILAGIAKPGTTIMISADQVDESMSKSDQARTIERESLSS